jgi:hypothetical protein
MVEYMTEVAKKGEELAKEKFGATLKELEDMIRIHLRNCVDRSPTTTLPLV